MSPTQTPPEALATEVAATSKSERARAAALRQAKADSKALYDVLATAAARDQDADVRASLIASANDRLALVAKALKALS